MYTIYIYNIYDSIVIIIIINADAFKLNYWDPLYRLGELIFRKKYFIYFVFWKYFFDPLWTCFGVFDTSILFNV